MHAVHLLGKYTVNLYIGESSCHMAVSDQHSGGEFGEEGQKGKKT